jgi:manganese-transporting P-type ATPase
MYKILALNSLISAFSLSALHLDGIRHSDTQVTIQGFLLSGCFLFLSWGKPIERLAKQRPQANIFNFYIITSIFGQFLVHIAALWYVVVQSKSWLPTDWKVDIDNMEDTKYEPNILSNAVYLISISMQVSTFMINYQVLFF